MKKTTEIRRVCREITNNRQRGSLGRIWGTAPLEIVIRGEVFTFENIEKFKQFLQGKTAVPAPKIKDMLNRTGKLQAEELDQLAMLERNISDTLTTATRDLQNIDNYLSSTTVMRFSQDYDWRQIMFELSKKPGDYRKYKLEAVTYYMKYLRSRIDIARSIIANHPNATQQDSSEATTQELYMPDPEHHEAPVKAGYIKQTGQKNKPLISQRLEKIPHGKPVAIDKTIMLKIPIKIASRKFIIDNSRTIPALISRNGDQYTIRVGENLIGRSTRCTIVLNPRFTDISRQHLIIERYYGNTLCLTDLSSRGTQIPIELLGG